MPASSTKVRTDTTVTSKEPSLKPDEQVPSSQLVTPEKPKKQTIQPMETSQSDNSEQYYQLGKTTFMLEKPQAPDLADVHMVTALAEEGIEASEEDSDLLGNSSADSAQLRTRRRVKLRQKLKKMRQKR
jgi:hypothetical protein